MIVKMLFQLKEKIKLELNVDLVTLGSKMKEKKIKKLKTILPFISICFVFAFHFFVCFFFEHLLILEN